MNGFSNLWWWMLGLLAVAVAAALGAMEIAAPDWFPWAGRVLQIVGYISAVASVIALWLAIAQTMDAKHVRESLSTRFIGEFPHFIPEIVKLLESAKRGVVIVCDFPSYGRYSRSEGWHDYCHPIQKKSELEMPVSLVCMTSGARMSFSRRQFFEKGEPEGNDWAKYRSKNRKKIQDLLRRHNNLAKEKTVTFNEVIEMLETDDANALQTVFARAERFETDAPMPLYFWICDGHTAVFSFATYSADKTEFGFLTSDQKLIESFMEAYKTYKNHPRSGSEESHVGNDNI